MESHLTDIYEESRTNVKKGNRNRTCSIAVTVDIKNKNC